MKPNEFNLSVIKLIGAFGAKRRANSYIDRIIYIIKMIRER